MADPARTPDRRGLLADLLGHPTSAVTRIGSGTDHEAFAVGEDLIARFAAGALGQAAADVEREAHVLDVVAGRLPVRTPRAIAVRPKLGLLVTTRIPGSSLLGRDLPSVRTAEAIGATLSAVHTIGTDVVGHLVPADPYPLTSYADDARAHLGVAEPALDAATLRAAAAALDAVPDDSRGAVFVHHDAGAEHLFVQGDTLSGVIDWADAAIADPARDLARVLRDFGPTAYRQVLEHYRPFWDADADARTWFLARCAALEDLAFGLAEQRAPYAAAALRSMTWLFPRAAASSP